MSLDFASDNVAPANPEILNAVLQANQGNAVPYGADQESLRLQDRFSQLFQGPVTLHLATTGTAANALALTSLVPSYGGVFCTSLAHINTDECGAPEFFTGGAKMIDVPTKDGKLSPQALEKAIENSVPGFVHRVQGRVVSITQTTELGTLYTLDEIAAIAAIAKRYGLKMHMDGARFANAVAALGVAPAALVEHIDVLTFGGTKNGCMMAEAVLFFGDTPPSEAPFYHKRAGMMASKMRYVAAQFHGYLDEDLWLRNARHANAMTARLAKGLAQLNGVTLTLPPQANMIFVHMPPDMVQRLEEAGARFYWIADAPQPAYRLVTAWNTDAAAVDAFLKHAAG